MSTFDKSGFQFDFETQRFIENRWETELGQKVLESIIEGIEDCSEIRGILDSYVLDHPDNYDPYAHPIYPKEKMKKDAFWVLTQDDLRGIHIYNKDLSNTKSLEKKHLSYSRFENCNLTNANLEMTELSYARFEQCNFDRACFAMSGGFNMSFRMSKLTNVDFFDFKSIECDFSGADLTGSYFENAMLLDMIVNHETKIDRNIELKRNERAIPTTELPDLHRSIRMAYERAEIWETSDAHLVEEQTSLRKYKLWPKFKENRSLLTFRLWFWSLLLGTYSNYATSPTRVVVFSFVVPVLFALIYLLAGLPTETASGPNKVLTALYYSITTFTTLGYGDITYSVEQSALRLVSTIEAFIGAVSMSLFVVVLARKMFR